MRMTIHIFLLVVISSIIFSCSPKETVEEVKVEKKDSLLDKINSPELKSLNGQILKDPGNAELYNKRAKVYIGLKLLDEALNDALRATKLDTTQAAYYLTLADVYFASNKTRYAKDILEVIVRKYPDNTEALLKLAELYFIVRQYENSITNINKALKIDENLAQAYYLKGSVFKEMGDTAKAISSMQTAIEQDNKFYDAFLSIGVLYASRKNPLAFEYFDNALRVRPGDENILIGKAKLLQDMDKINESIEMYESVLAANRSNTIALYNLGAITLDKKKDASKAIDYFSRAIVADPKYTEAYYARGVSFEMLKDINNAKADYNMCLQVSPNYEPAIEALNKLDKK